MKRQRTRDVLAIFGITAIIGLFFFRLFFPTLKIIITPDFGQSDALAGLSFKFIYAAQLAKHQLPLWTSKVNGGFPLFAESEEGAFFMPNLLLYSLLSPLVAYNVSILLSACILGWGMYIWLRLIGLRRISSVFGSITLALSGYFIAQMTHITIIESISLFPAIAASTLMLATKKKWRYMALLALLISQQIFVGSPQVTFITVLFLIAYWLWITKIKLRIMDVLQLVAALGLSLGLAAVQLLPSMEFSSLTVGAGSFTPDQAMAFSYPFKQLLTIFYPFALGNPVVGTFPNFVQANGSIFWENTAFIGFIPLILLLVFLAIERFRNNKILFFWIMLAGSFLLMTGKFSPLYVVFSLWPFSIFRVPSRFVWVFIIALVILCTNAFDRLLSKVKSARIIPLLTVFIILLQILTIFAIWTPYHLLEPANQWLEKPTLAQFITPNAETLTIGGTQLFNAIYAPHGWQLTDPKKDPSYVLRNTFSPDKNVLFGVNQIEVDASRLLRRSQVFVDLLSQSITTDDSHATVSAFGSKLLNLLSIRNVITTLTLSAPNLNERATLTAPSMYIGYFNNPSAIPQAYIAERAISVSSVEQAVRVMISDDFVPGKTVLVEETATPSANLVGGRVTIKATGEGYFRIGVTNRGPASILVLNQTYYPGWKATVDGHAQSVFPVNIKEMGILIPSGTHDVRFFFQSDSFVKGAWVSGISLLVTIALVVFGFFVESPDTAQTAALHGRHRANSSGT